MTNPNDPLGLFSGDYQTPIPSDPISKNGIKAADGTRSVPATDWSGIIVGILIALAGLLIYDRMQHGQSSDGDRQQQEQGQDQDSKKQDDKQPKIAGKTLVFIHERNPQSIEHDLLLREMPKFCADAKLQFRAFDDDTPDDPIPGLIAWAKGKGIDPPFVVLTDRDDKPSKVIKWPSGLEDLQKFVK